MPDVRDVKEFWEDNPLWTGESTFAAGSREFFEEHDSVYLDDCLGGDFDDRVLPDVPRRQVVFRIGT